MKITRTEIEAVLNVPALRGMTLLQARIAVAVEKIDRESNYRYWAQRAAGRGYAIACERLEAIEHLERVVNAAIEAAQPVEIAAAVQTVAQPKQSAPREASAPRCCFHKAIRRCFAIAKERGLDTRADEAMRAAFALYLCSDVPSRESLTGSDWTLLGSAIKSNRLAW